MKNDSLRNRVAVITGASSGMGEAIAVKFASEGSKVVLAARQQELLDKVANRIRSNGSTPLVVRTDVAKYEDVKRLIDTAIGEFGQIDVMVNAAGYGLFKEFMQSSVEEIDSMIDVNLKGVCYGCYAVLPHMIERKQGHIINIGSVCSVRHAPLWAVYTGAKFGVLGFTKSVYEEVRQFGIRMNLICPAAVNTNFLDVAGLPSPWPLEDLIQPEDIAELTFMCLNMPPNVQIENLIVWPTCQPTN